MSEIFSFRLSKSNPREARALEILLAKTIEGISLRQVVTDGLLALASRPSEADFSGGETIRSMFNLIIEILGERNNQFPRKCRTESEGANTNILSDKFKASIRCEVKKGLRAPD